MRVRSTLLACAAVASLTGAVPSPATAAPHPTVLASKATYAGGSVNGATLCADTCVIGFAVREGERYVHLNTSAPYGAVALDVKTGAAGYVRVCMNTKRGALPIGASHILVVPTLSDTTCGGQPAPTGTIVAYFSAREVALDYAMLNATPDPDREVTGGI